MRFPSIALFVLVLLPLSLSGQTFGGFGGTSSSSAERYPVHGTVVDSVTGQPIRHALVMVQIDKPHSVFTDEEGIFQFPRLPRTTTTFAVFKPGYKTGQGYADRRRSQTVTIGPDTPSVTIKLIPQAQVFGTITDTNGEPLENVALRLFRLQIENGLKKRVPVNEARSNPEGEFTFFDLSQGDYLLSAGPLSRSDNPFRPGDGSRQVYMQIFYPGVPDIASATSFHLDPGKKQQVDLSLPAARTFVVSGTIAGFNPQNGNIQCVDLSGQSVMPDQNHIDENGFSLRLPAGNLLIKVHSADAQGNVLYGEAPLNITGDVNDVHIGLSKIQVPINMQWENSSPTQTESQQYPPQLRLFPLEPTHSEAWSQSTGGPGHWTSSFSNLETGRYRIDLSDSGWYAGSITSSGVDLKTDPLVVGPGASQPIEVTLRNDFAQLQIKTDSADLAPESRATIIVIPEFGVRRLWQAMTFGPRSATTLSLPPGRYSVYAFQASQADDLEFADPEVMKEFTRFAKTIDLQPKQRSEVTVPVIGKTQ
jgi:hypothetical protein